MGAVVSDATPLIALAKLGGMPWLQQLFGEILIPEAVYREVAIAGTGRVASAEIQSADWIQVRSVLNRNRVRVLLTQLDLGESEAIVLAQEIEADWLLMDEIKGRAVALALGLPIVGTVGLLVMAKEMGLVLSVRPLLDALASHNFRLSKNVIRSILIQAGELDASEGDQLGLPPISGQE